MNQTPTNGVWSGSRGESTFTSNNPAVKGQKVNYSNGYPNFSPFTKHTVHIDDFTNKVINSSGDSRYNLHKEADQILAKKLRVQSSIIKKFRRKQKFTWHEVEDMGTLQLGPTKINSKFGHVGGIAEATKRGRND